jgi:prepilin-type processing-associated H-X9-DG protein
MFCERLIPGEQAYRGTSYSDAADRDPVRFLWYTPTAFPPAAFLQPGMLAEFADYCSDGRNRIAVESPVAVADGSRRVSGEEQAYNHLVPPNAAGCVNGPPPSQSGTWLRSGLKAVTASSLHRGGVNLLYCDGSVRFITSSIARDVWWAMGTHAEGDVVAAP